MPVKRNNAIPIAIAVAGIVVELIAIALIASERLTVTTGMPLVLLGMFMAFVPLFVLSRRSRR
jgi:hypothetical protein